jgi:excisionase family DNA binding protein
MENASLLKRQTYTVGEASQLLGISRGQGYALARTGELPGAIKLGGRIVVSRPALDRLLAGEEESAASVSEFPETRESRLDRTQDSREDEHARRTQ